MYENRGPALVAKFPVNASDWSGEDGMEFERLVGTVVSHIDFVDNRIVEIEGRDRDGQARWRLSILGSARFTFSRIAPDSAWLVECNFDRGGTIRSADKTMMMALCGAVVESFRAEEQGLFIASADGRAIEVPYELNDEGVVVTILPHEVDAAPERIVLTGDL